MSTAQNTWDSGQGVVTESGLMRTVVRPKTYSTHNRAATYGHSRDPAPITMLDGSTRWIALPFWRHTGESYSYKESA